MVQSFSRQSYKSRRRRDVAVLVALSTFLALLACSSEARHRLQVGLVGGGVGCGDQGQQPAALVADGGAPPTAERALGIEHLEQATVERVQADPGLLQREPQLLRQFEAAPWLLPPRTAALPYAGVHDLDALAALRAQPRGGLERTLSLLLFNREFALLAQNCVYSLVKFARVTNYIVGTWSTEDMEACRELNLPCADVSAFLPLPLRPDEGAEFNSHNYHVLCWLRPPLVAHLLSLGYTVHFTDADVAYTAKPLWESFLNLLAVSDADAAFMWENMAVNAGQYVILPTPGGRHLAEQWAEAAKGDYIARALHDQFGLYELQPQHWELCWTGAPQCKALREQARAANATKAIVRSFWPPHFMRDADTCALSTPERAPPLEVCHWTVLFVHTICNADPANKRAVLRKLGFWFLDSEGEGGCPTDGAASRLPRCRPLRWRDPAAEAVHLGCSQHRLALTSAVASEEEFERLRQRISGLEQRVQAAAP